LAARIVLSADRATAQKAGFRTGLPRHHHAAHRRVQMVDPNDPELLAALETFANEVQAIFSNDEQDAGAGLIAARQKQYMLASLAVPKLLRTIGRPAAAEPFLSLDDAWRDVVERKIQPRLFKVEKPDKHAASKRGRKFDPTETQRVRAYLCVGLQYLIASGVKEDAAVNFVVQNYRAQFQNLLRPGADLAKSIPGWLKKFATDEINDEEALLIYKEEMGQLEEDKKSADRAMLRRYGVNMIGATAFKAAQIIPLNPELDIPD
jgi:hypothetical protein